jgi:hypothetical protein
MPIILVALILLSGLMQPLIPVSAIATLYAISLTLKSLIIFVLPFIIFGLLFKTAIQLSKKASFFVVGLFLLIMLSNYASTIFSGAVGSLIYQLDMAIAMPDESASLQPAYAFEFQK